MDGEDYKDGIDISSMISTVASQRLSPFPTTSQPSIPEFQALYEQELNRGHDIISIHVSSKLSGTVNSATQAKSALGTPEHKIIDSKLASFALGLVTLKAPNLQHKIQTWNQSTNQYWIYAREHTA
ncbi:MAG: hypothetical protein CM1200mP15_19800 [Dehalococcoidia bacterium]|nr:MAG: hypothetical protein CM1200mP15_19800 [Dehalococcoidia bacterium]